MPPRAATQQEEEEERLAISRRDGQAFARWLMRSEEALRLALRSFARTVDVEAVIQEAALRLWQLAPRIEPDGKPNCLLRWTITVARNLARDLAARAGREIPLDDHDDPPAPPAPRPADPYLARRIGECRKRLPAKPGAAITARVAGGGQLSDRELAAQVGMSFDAFRQNLARARRLLEDCLRGFGIEVRSVPS